MRLYSNYKVYKVHNTSELENGNYNNNCKFDILSLFAYRLS